jgi:hypothetical protein
MEDVALATDLDKAVMKIVCFNDDSLGKGRFLMFSWWYGRRFVLQRHEYEQEVN